MRQAGSYIVSAALHAAGLALLSLTPGLSNPESSVRSGDVELGSTVESMLAAASVSHEPAAELQVTMPLDSVRVVESPAETAAPSTRLPELRPLPFDTNAAVPDSAQTLPELFVPPVHRRSDPKDRPPLLQPLTAAAFAAAEQAEPAVHSVQQTTEEESSAAARERAATADASGQLTPLTVPSPPGTPVSDSAVQRMLRGRQPPGRQSRPADADAGRPVRQSPKAGIETRAGRELEAATTRESATAEPAARTQPAAKTQPARGAEPSRRPEESAARSRPARPPAPAHPEPPESADKAVRSPAPSSSARQSREAADARVGGAGQQSGADEMPRLLPVNTQPEYPLAALRAGQQGRVMLAVLVSERGRAAKVRLVTSSGFQLLDDSAITAVRTWKFRPAERSGRPTACWVKVPVNFQIDTTGR